MNKKLCIYHGDCPDGFGAAWALNEYFSNFYNIIFIPAKHGQSIDWNKIFYEKNIDEVFIVDFSFSYEELQKIKNYVPRVFVIDHHITAIKALENLLTPIYSYEQTEDMEGIFSYFSTEHSGAYLTWEFFFENEVDIPLLIKYVSDYDCWKHQLPNCEAISLYIHTIHYHLDNWSLLNREIETNLSNVITKGNVLIRYRNKLVDSICKNAIDMPFLHFSSIPTVTAPAELVDKVAERLYQNAPLARIYRDTPEGRKWSLRSHSEHGVNVAELAKQFGGGGHVHSAAYIER